MNPTALRLIALSDTYIRQNGYNAFSFHQLAKLTGLKTASIHYHFSNKSALGEAVVKQQKEQFIAFEKAVEGLNPAQRLRWFFSYYAEQGENNQICILGALGSEISSLGAPLAATTQELSEHIREWLRTTLKEGRKKEEFDFDGKAGQLAQLILASLVGGLQLQRLAGNNLIGDISQRWLDQLLIR